MIANGYINTDYQAKRDEYIDLVQKHGNNLVDGAREYYSWSDARYVHSCSERTHSDRLPKTRDNLLRETRA